MLRAHPRGNPHRAPLRASSALAALGAAVLACSSGSSGPKPPKCETQPDICDGAPVRLATESTYRRLFPGTDEYTLLALSDLQPELGTGTLRVLGADPATRKAKPPRVVSTRAHPTAVRVAPAAPARALFLDSAGTNGVGALTLVDLTTGEPTVAPNGGKTLSNNFEFGPDGRSFIYLSNWNADAKRGEVYWSDGTTARLVGKGAPARAMVFDAQHRIAVAAVDVNELGVGALASVRMADGTVERIAATARVVAAEGPSVQPLFSINAASGERVAYADQEGGIYVTGPGVRAPVAVDTRGEAPAVSADGQTIAYLTQDEVLTVRPGEEPRTQAQHALEAPVPPLFSPDGTSLFWQGAVTYTTRGGVTDIYTTPIGQTADGEDPPEASLVGHGVAVGSLRFTEDGVYYAAIDKLLDVGGQPSYEGIGRAVVGKPGAGPRVVAEGVMAGGLALLPHSGRVAFLGGFSFGQKQAVGDVFVAALDGGAPVKVGTKALAGTLVAAADFGAFAYLAEPAETALADGWPTAKAYGGTPDEKARPRALKDDAVAVSFSRGGRLLVIVGSGAETGVWSLPAPW